MPVAALGGNSVGWCVDVGMGVTGASEGGCLVCGAASRFTPLQGGNSVGWCVDVGMCVTGASELSRAAAWCGGHSSVWPPASRLPGDDVGVAPKLPYLAG